MPQIFNQSVYTIFGGLKKQWPTLKTMAVLNWQTFPSDLPLDIWVDEYLIRGYIPQGLLKLPLFSI